MDIASVIELANRWAKLGGAVQAQVEELLNDDSEGDYSMGALASIKEFFEDCDQLGVEGMDWALEAVLVHLVHGGADPDEE